MRRLLWILLAILTIALLVLVLQQNEAALAELSRFDTSSLETKIMALALVGLIALALFRHRFTHALESALIWIMIAALLTLGYTYRFELREVADRVMAELVPGHAATRGRTVEIARGSGGGFSAPARAPSSSPRRPPRRRASRLKSSTIPSPSRLRTGAPAPHRLRSTDCRSATSPSARSRRLSRKAGSCAPIYSA